MKKIKTAKELVNLFSKIIEKKSSKNISIYQKWEDIIGNKNLALKCNLEDIKNNSLIIRTNHTGWSQQILFQKNQIIKNINKIYPELNIKDLSIIITDKMENISIYTFKKENEEKKQKINHDLKKALQKLKKTIIDKNKELIKKE